MEAHRSVPGPLSSTTQGSDVSSQPTIADIQRELLKIRDVLVTVDEHLAAKDTMNAALHMSKEVRSTPLAAAVHGARKDIERLMLVVGGEQ
jgi:hypothetical protein